MLGVRYLGYCQYVDADSWTTERVFVWSFVNVPMLSTEVLFCMILPNLE